jgi:plasmid maintenance system antidote protein VapI
MATHNPPTSREFITSVYLEPNDISGRERAITRGVSASHIEPHPQRRQRNQPAEGATAFEGVGRSPDSWPAMQSQYELWRAKQHVDLARVGKIRLTAH